MQATIMHLSSVVYVTTFSSAGAYRLVHLSLPRALTPAPLRKSLSAIQLYSLAIHSGHDQVQIASSSQPCRGLWTKNGDKPLLRAPSCFL
jgi:hypothetical protein